MSGRPIVMIPQRVERFEEVSVLHVVVVDLPSGRIVGVVEVRRELFRSHLDVGLGPPNWRPPFRRSVGSPPLV